MMLKMVNMPSYTQYLGPLLSVNQGKYATRLSAEHKSIEELIERLPTANYYHVKTHPSLTNWLPFYWNGFQQTTRYTYIIQDITDQEQVWKSFRSNIRREIRKAREEVEVIQSDQVDDLITLQRMTFDRQGKSAPQSDSQLRNISDSVHSKEQGAIFYARDKQNQLHSGLLLVWDDRMAYYLVGGSDPELRTSGAASLLMWRAIQHASEKVTKFNFEGSMIRGIERFFRGFGGEQVAYFSMKKYSPSFLQIPYNLISN